jgi:hypothetical protein
MGEFGTGSKIVYWGDLKQRDDKMRAMRGKYELNESRRALIREAREPIRSPSPARSARAGPALSAPARVAPAWRGCG